MHWKAVYNDGTWLDQFNADSSENKYADIDRDKIIQFCVIMDNKTVVVIHLDSKKKLIFRKRVAMHVAGRKAGQQEVVFLAGWQENRHGINTQMICFVFPDGRCEVVDRFREDHPWFYSIKFLPEERT